MCIFSVRIKVITEFHAVLQARGLMAGLEPGFLYISGHFASQCATSAPPLPHLSPCLADTVISILCASQGLFSVLLGSTSLLTNLCGSKCWTIDKATKTKKRKNSDATFQKNTVKS
ncbi:hypothetical protein PoB_003831500 [Plakobranchus ocellatus]|uniref:Uncharacterized protein n=1 Tax=Plakobranchus ocellatus TaxID=259542 RepID=A0AAV4AX43_9GAST|nr:hypothetical protein PoB_003831500 [Plakobranchus ocellatus]